MSNTPAHETTNSGRQIYTYAIELMRMGMSGTEIENALTKKGVSSSIAHNVVADLVAIRSKAIRGSAFKKMITGGILFVFGIIVTVGSLANALTSSDGGAIIVAFGSIIGGGAQFIKGLGDYFMFTGDRILHQEKTGKRDL